MSLEVSITKTINDLAAEVCEREGFVLYDIEYVSGQKIARIYIDKEGGVSLDDCASVSKGVNLLLDIEDPIESSYSLEVSSPGLERLLKLKWHYDSQVGKRINVVLKARTKTTSELGCKQLTGILKNSEDMSFLISDEKLSKEVSVPYDDVHKCNLMFDYDKNFKK